MATNLSRVPRAKSTSRIVVDLDWVMMRGRKSTMPKIVDIVDVMTNKRTNGEVLIVDISDRLPMDISALKRKLKRSGIEIHKSLVNYGGMVRDMRTINSKDARNFWKGEHK